MKDQAELVAELLAEARPEGECLLYEGGCTSAGYGFVYFCKKQFYTHRLVAAHAAGRSVQSLQKSDHVRHSCDVPNCINPDHLTIGTQRENIDDMIQKGRVTEGEKHGSTKLSAADVAEIRRLYATGLYYHRHLAEMFGCSKANIGLICQGKSRRKG